MLRKLHFLIFVLVVTLLIPSFVFAKNWQEIEKEARGQEINWVMYGGLPSVNSYVNGYLANLLQKRYSIKLKQIPVQDLSEIVGKILIEKQLGKTTNGRLDLIWINGENFRTAKRNYLLYGPFAHLLPNSKYLDQNSLSLKTDFGEKVEGYESPWGGAQFVFSYDIKKIRQAPVDMKGLINWIKMNPGRFTYPAPPDFTGSAFVRHGFYYAAKTLNLGKGPYTRKEFQLASKKCFEILKEINPYLWRTGKTYPESPVRLNQLFVDGEVDFSMSYNPAEASKMITDGIFPKTVRTFVLKDGTIANTHFVAIPFNAKHKAAAMVLANLLLAPETQLKKANPMVWGDPAVISLKKLPENWRNKFEKLPLGKATLPAKELQLYQLPELPARQLVKLEKGWIKHVLKKR